MAGNDIGPKIGIDGAAEFNASIRNINSALRAMAAEQKTLEASFKSTTSAQEKQERRSALLTEQIKTLEKAFTKASDNVDYANRVFHEGSTELNNAIAVQRRVGTELENARKKLDNVNRGLDENITELDAAADSAARYAKSLAEMEAAEKILDIMRALGRGFEDVVDSSISFESAFTAVKKTVDGTPEQMDEIAAAIKQMATETGIAVEDIAAVAANAGQLGVATENIVSFSRTMIDLGESTNLGADEAAIAIAKLTNVMGTSEGNVSRLGSAIVALGNHFATNESAILEMTQRIASAGRIAGLTESEVLALATAMSSVGIEAEAGGTAMTQTLNAIEKAVSRGGDSLETFAQTAGMSAEEFSARWKTDAAGALQAFIQGLAGINAAGGSVTAVLDSLGLSGIRQSNMLRSLSLASDMLTDALTLSNDAWNENAALANEAGNVYANTEHRISAAKQSLNNLSIALGDAFSPQIRAGADALNQLAQALTATAQESPEIIQSFGGIAAGAGAAVAAFTALKTASAALSGLGIAVSALAPIAGVGAALGLLATAVAKGKQDWQDYVDSMTPAVTSSAEIAAEIERLQKESDELQAKWDAEGWGLGDGTNYYKEIAAREDAIEQLTQRLAENASAQSGTTVAVDENTVATALAIEKQIQFEEAMGGVTELLQKQQERIAALKETFAGTFKVFETAPELVKTSLADMSAALQSQKKYWDDFGQNMKAAGELGLDEGLLQSFAAMGTEGAGYIASIISELQSMGLDSDEARAKVEELNREWQEAQEAQNSAAAQTSAAISESAGEVAEVMKGIAETAAALDKTEELYQYGEKNIKEYLAGLETQAGPTYDALEEMGKEMLAALQRGINSGSLSMPGVSGGGFSVDGSHKTGLDYVPYDDYLAVLHKGEMVLPADDADDYRSGRGSGGAGTVINLYPQTVDEATIDYIYNRFSVRMGADV